MLRYYTVYEFMYKNLGLTGVDLNVFAFIYSHRKYFGSLKTLSEAVGVKSLTTIQTSLKRLISLGYINKDKPDNKFCTCTYSVNYDNEEIPSKSVSENREWDNSCDKTKIGEW